VDTRWMGSNFNMKTYIHQHSAFPFSDEKVSVPKCSRPGATEANSCCIFLTPRVELVELVADTVTEGKTVEYVVQFDLPMDVLPTHRSLCSTVVYMFDICVVNIRQNTFVHSYFPFTVWGAGTAMLPFPTKCCCLVAHLVDRNEMQQRLLGLDCHHQLSSMENEDSNNYSPESLNRAVAAAFTLNIIDEEHVCRLLLRTSAQQLIHPHFNAKYERSNILRLCYGCIFQLIVDMREQQQRCYAVRFKLLQREIRFDGAQMQVSAA
jgi:hypothetical protein